MKYIIQFSSTLPDAFNPILDAYQDIGGRMPSLHDSQHLFLSQPYLQEILVIIYQDVLDFQREVISHLKQRREFVY